MKFTIYQESRIGKRKNNQDRNAYCYSREALLMVIADGMGGHLHGEIAAQIAVQFIIQAFQANATLAQNDPGLFLSRSINNAHQAILDYAQAKQLLELPRTTLVACLVHDNAAWWAHAGDSRLYVLRKGHVVEQTRDHSRVRIMLDSGLIDAEAAARHPGRNRIYSCLGGNHAPHIEFSKRFRLRDDDIIVLCTDGLWGPVGETGLTRLCGTNIMQSVPLLMDEAEALAGKACDNLSMIAMCWHSASKKAASDDLSVSTHTLDLRDFTTRLDSFDQSRANKPEQDLSEDEIEQAIAEINAAIQKFSK